jgi:serine protease
MRCSILMLTLGLACAAGASADEYNPVAQPTHPALPTGRIIVKFRTATATEAAESARISRLAVRAGLPVTASRLIAPQTHVVELLVAPAADTEAAQLARLRSDPSVEFAERDGLRFPHQVVPTDTDYSSQWYLQPPANPTPATPTVSAIDAQTGWSTTEGSAGVVIAQLDTGVRFDHADLLRAQAGGRLLPGYDFISADPGSSGAPTYLTANDGDGWDADPSDPGDWISSSDTTNPYFASNCPKVTNSSWHGTRTAGIMAALTNNGFGVAGITWKTWILPVRVLGKCGGYDSDIVAGMQWAAGIHVAGVPDNPYPAQIENMSLGGAESCPSVYSNVIPTLLAKGVLIVASAGNEGGPVDAPANCPGVAAIAGLREAGDKVGYSSLGPEVTLSAPAGNCGQNSAGTGLCLYELETTVNLGLTTPAGNGFTDQANPNLGTSFSAPLVSGTAALMLAVNGDLVAPQLIARLKEGVPDFKNGVGSSKFPATAVDVVPPASQPPQCGTPGAFGDTTWQVECLCTTAVCGAGVLNVPGALAAALRPIAGVTVPSSVSTGQMVALDASPSTAACGHAVQSYAWAVTGGTGTLSSNSGVQTSLIAAPAAGNPVTVQLTVTDDQAKTDVVNIIVTSNSAAAISASTSVAPPSVAGTHACLVARSVTSPMSTATLTASVKSVQVGSALNLNWSSTGANQCRASNGSASDGWRGNLATSGSKSVSEATVGVYNYTLACYGATVSNAATASVSVEPAVTLTSSATSAQTGQAFTLTWTSKQATSCTPSGGGGGDGWSAASSTSGMVQVTESTAGSYTYTQTCADGSVSGTAQVRMSISAPAPGGGGGGGAVDLLLIAALSSIGFLRRR